MSKPTALVIGSSRGIGKELSLQLSQNYQVYGTMRTSQEVEGNKFKVLTLDINDEKSVDEAAEKIEKLVSLPCSIHKPPFNRLHDKKGLPLFVRSFVLTDAKFAFLRIYSL